MNNYYTCLIQNVQFWRDCERGDLAAVQEAIKDGGVNLDEASPYYVCCICDFFDIVSCKTYIGAGKPITNLFVSIIFQKLTALHIAVVHGHEELVEYLLCNGADPNSTSDVSYYVMLLLCYVVIFMLCCYYGMLLLCYNYCYLCYVVIMLCCYGTYTQMHVLSLFTQSQFTPLLTAARAGDSKIVEHLLNGKAHTNTCGHVSKNECLYDQF